MSVTGVDPDLDANYLNLKLYDAMGAELPVDEFGETIYYENIPSDAAPFFTGLADFSFNIRVELPNLDVATELGVEIEDLFGNVSEEFIVAMGAHPTLLRKVCDLKALEDTATKSCSVARRRRSIPCRTV